MVTEALVDPKYIVPKGAEKEGFNPRGVDQKLSRFCLGKCCGERNRKCR